jgi:hypothetical protein
MSDPRFAELLEKYWNAAYQQGKEGREYDDAAGTAEGAEWDLVQYVDNLRASLASARRAGIQEALEVCGRFNDARMAHFAIRSLMEKPE